MPQYTMPAWSRATFAIALAGVLLVAGVAPLYALPLGTGPDQPPALDSQTASLSESEIETTYRIDVQPDGDAQWTINRTLRFENDTQREGFESVAERFRDGDYGEQTVSAFEGASDLAAETTGRQMEITNVSRDTRVGADTGSLSLSFTWTNFSREEDGRLHVDDAFQTEPRWFPGLSERETLIIARPSGYQYYSASTNVQDRLLRWEGSHAFDSDRPYAVFDSTSTVAGNTTTLPAERTDGPSTLVAVGIALVAVLAVVGYANRTGRLPGQRPTIDSDEGASTAAESSQADGGTDGRTSAEPDRETVADDGPEPAERDSTEGAIGAAGGAVEDSEQDEIDEELLSDEERVERLLEENGGRMKQARIVEETGWSSAKVSQLLSSMAEDDQVEKLRIGRENLISFPDEEPEQ